MSEDKTVVDASKVKPEHINAVGKVTEVFKNIVLDSPLVGEILLNTRREISYDLPTLAVAPDRANGGIKMLVNPQFFLDLYEENKEKGEEHQKAVVFHEITHIVQNVFRRFHEQLTNQSTGYLVNIACDASINQYNRYELPEGCVTLESLQELVSSRGSDVVLKPKETSEYYFNALQAEVEKREQEMKDQMGDSECPSCGGTGKKQPQDGQGDQEEGDGGQGQGQGEEGQDGDQQGQGSGSGQGQEQGDQQGQGSGSGHDHGEDCPDCGGSGSANDLENALRKYAESKNSDHAGDADEMSKMNPLDQAALDSLIKKAINKQKQHDLKRGVGAGGSIVDILPQDKVKLHKKIWENLLNKVLDGETPSADDFDVVYGKPNRRSAFSVYGKKRLFHDHTVYVGVDTSASVSDRELTAFMSHVNKALKGQELRVNLIHCDYDVSHVDMNVKRISKKKGIALHGRGGTDLCKILDFIIEKEGTRKKVDLILMTDGETPWRKEKNINTSVIYTESHSKIPGVEHEAVLDVPSY